MRNKRLLGLVVIAILLLVVVGAVFADGIVDGVRCYWWHEPGIKDDKGKIMKGTESWDTYFENQNDYVVTVTVKSSGILKDTQVFTLLEKKSGNASKTHLEGKWSIKRVYK
jgi:hypothetical protein